MPRARLAAVAGKLAIADKGDLTPNQLKTEVLSGLTVALALVPTVVQDSFWRRRIVSSSHAAREPLKVYFDNASHNSGRPRGWTNCETHCCIKHFQCDHFSSREQLCAYALAWVAAPEHLVRDKLEHLAYKPPEADVASIAGAIVMTQL